MRIENEGLTKVKFFSLWNPERWTKEQIVDAGIGLRMMLEVKLFGDPPTTITITCWEKPKKKGAEKGHLKILKVGDFEITHAEQKAMLKALRDAKLLK